MVAVAFLLLSSARSEGGKCMRRFYYLDEDQTNVRFTSLFNYLALSRIPVDAAAVNAGRDIMNVLFEVTRKMVKITERFLTTARS